MSHIADHHNQGRCAQLRTIENARGAYADHIKKEALAADSAKRREVIKAMNIKCPRCALQVVATRCGNCQYFPVPLPSKDALDAAMAEFGRGKAHSSQPNLAASLNATAAAVDQSEYWHQEESPEVRLERLQSLIDAEKAASSSMLQRVMKLSHLVENYGRTASPAPKQMAAVKPLRKK